MRINNFCSIFGISLIFAFGAVSCTDNSTTDEDNSVLPVGQFDGAGSCMEPVTLEPQSLESWLAASSAVIVGTIESISIVDHPVIVGHQSEITEPEEYVFGHQDDCLDSEDPVFFAEIHLRDVQSISGMTVENEVSIRVDRPLLQFWNIRPREGADGVQWYRGDELVPGIFEPGARIGGGIRQSALTGHLAFHFRLFEKIGNHVHLQEFSADTEADLSSDSECPASENRSMYLGLEHHEKDWDGFLAEIQSVDVDIERIRERDERVDFYRQQWYEMTAEDAAPLSYRFEYPMCTGTIYDVPEPEGDGDAE